MRYDIVYDPGDDVYWVVDLATEVRAAGPFYNATTAEQKLADYLSIPENDLEP